jgi:hypothetical protein
VRLLESKSWCLRRLACAAGFLLAAAGPALATDLNLSVQSGGSNTVTVLPGALVPYSVVGELNDAASDGLAAVSLDLSFTGGPLPAADEPTTQPMLSFDRPAGLTNPAGFGGTVAAGVLVQVGGAQNTIRNVFAPYPNGNVVTDVAQLGQALPLVTGHLTAPATAGSYTLAPSNVVANVIRQGQNGIPFWRVDKALPGTVTPLTVIVTLLKPRR